LATLVSVAAARAQTVTLAPRYQPTPPRNGLTIVRIDLADTRGLVELLNANAHDDTVLQLPARTYAKDTTVATYSSTLRNFTLEAAGPARSTSIDSVQLGGSQIAIRGLVVRGDLVLAGSSHRLEFSTFIGRFTSPIHGCEDIVVESSEVAATDRAVFGSDVAVLYCTRTRVSNSRVARLLIVGSVEQLDLTNNLLAGLDLPYTGEEGPLTDLRFTGNRLSGTGAAFTRCSHALVENNTFTDIARVALSFEECDHLTIRGNTFIRVGASAILARALDLGFTHRQRVSQWIGDVTIEENTITDAGRGIWLDHVVGARIYLNTIVDARLAALYLRESSPSQIVHNTLMSAGYAAAFTSAPETLARFEEALRPDEPGHVLVNNVLVAPVPVAGEIPTVYGVVAGNCASVAVAYPAIAAGQATLVPGGAALTATSDCRGKAVPVTQALAPAFPISAAIKRALVPGAVQDGAVTPPPRAPLPGPARNP
jgi:hypothetical protein